MAGECEETTQSRRRSRWSQSTQVPRSSFPCTCPCLFLIPSAPLPCPSILLLVVLVLSLGLVPFLFLILLPYLLVFVSSCNILVMSLALFICSCPRSCLCHCLSFVPCLCCNHLVCYTSFRTGPVDSLLHLLVLSFLFLAMKDSLLVLFYSFRSRCCAQMCLDATWSIEGADYPHVGTPPCSCYSSLSLLRLLFLLS